MDTGGQPVEWEDENGNEFWKNPDGTGGEVFADGDVQTFNEEGDATSFDGMAETPEGPSNERTTDEKVQLEQDE